MKSLFKLLLIAASSASLVSAACSQNNCYRAFNGAKYTASAQAFCSSFTTGLTTASSAIPTYGAPYCTTVDQISSVCSCAYPASSTSSLKTSSSPLKISSSSTTSSPSSTFQTTTITGAPVSPYGPGCNADNCLRALDGGKAQSFCSGFTSSGYVFTGFPSYATQCTGSTSARVSSACTCLNYQASATPILAVTTTAAVTTTTAVTTSAAANSSIAIVSDSPPWGAGCNADNCLRAFDRGMGQAFCSAYTASGYSFSGFPSYATQCTDSTSARVSSACTCLNVGSFPATAAASTASTSPSFSYFPNTTSLSSSPSSTSSLSTSFVPSDLSPLPSSSSVLIPSVGSSSSPPSASSIVGPYPYNHCPGTGDNCLRAMIREGGPTATDFCATYTTAVFTTTTALPTYASLCTADPTSQLSSACSCLFPPASTSSGGVFISYTTGT